MLINNMKKSGEKEAKKEKKIKKIKELKTKIKSVKELKMESKEDKNNKIDSLEEEIKIREDSFEKLEKKFVPQGIESANLEFEEAEERISTTERRQEQTLQAARYQSVRELPYSSRRDNEIRPGIYADAQSQNSQQEYALSEESSFDTLRETKQPSVFHRIEDERRIGNAPLSREESFEDQTQEYQDTQRQYQLKRRRHRE